MQLSPCSLLATAPPFTHAEAASWTANNDNARDANDRNDVGVYHNEKDCDVHGDCQRVEFEYDHFGDCFDCDEDAGGGDCDDNDR